MYCLFTIALTVPESLLYPLELTYKNFLSENTRIKCKIIIFTLGDEVPLYGRETALCEEPKAGDCGPTLASDVFVSICGDWDRRLGTGLGPTGVTDGFHVLVPPL